MPDPGNRNDAPTLSNGDQAASDAFAERLLGAALGTFDTLAVYLGDRLGYYRALADGGAATSGELAARTKTHERYAREWLEQQATSGILEVSGEGGESTFSLPAGHADVLTNQISQNYMAPIARMQVSATRVLDKLLAAYRTGGGVAYEDYGADMREGQAAINRPAFLQSLPDEWIRAMPDVHARLQADPHARVADIGCGAGWSSIGIAHAYPKVRVDGFDLDEASIVLANENLRGTGLEDRVTFAVRDAGDPTLAGQYDLVAAFEMIHDLSRPVDVLRTMKNLVAPGGAVLVVDERVNDDLTPNGDEVERVMYGWSILICLPNGMADQPSAGTGTVMRPSVLRQYATEAGFRDVEVLPVENFFFRLYRLHV
jgi:2-polyprenyl-3-methyl-5-hydroxy-6-metoxy-1,4-benzoquinol methylase